MFFIGVDKNYDDGLSLAAALWKRSTVLYEMKRIGQCLDDVKLCIKEKLPESLRLFFILLKRISPIFNILEFTLKLDYF